MAVEHVIAQLGFATCDPTGQVSESGKVTLKPPVAIKGSVLLTVCNPAQHFMMREPFLGFGNGAASDVVQHQLVPELIGGA